jgi:flagellar biosynthesis chaperone FliJ
MSTANAKIRAELKQATARAAPSPDTRDSAAEGAGQEQLRVARQRISTLEAELGQQRGQLQASKAAVEELQAASTSFQAARNALQVSHSTRPPT